VHPPGITSLNHLTGAPANVRQPASIGGTTPNSLQVCFNLASLVTSRSTGQAPRQQREGHHDL